ncbi:hypothetical protein CE91St46_08300 [Eubacteriales bacterium]|nr:hypothetical protein CE91St46_08300 [Eubacteriales bacterium]GKH62361.1 hypothetical protein CE91St47_08300 [Eubacteriales bacterium]
MVWGYQTAQQAPKRGRGRPTKGEVVNPEHLSDNQRAQLQFLTEANPRLYRAYLLKGGFWLARRRLPMPSPNGWARLSGAGFQPFVSCA